MQVIYPGTFDPITNGHVDLIERAASLFGPVLVAIAPAVVKSPVFSLPERLDLAQAIFRDREDVEICELQGLLVDFARQRKVDVILRGLRAVSDFEYEFQLAGMNRRLAPELETVFLAPAEQYSYISSSLVREIASLGGDVCEFVHPLVMEALDKKLNQ